MNRRKGPSPWRREGERRRHTLFGGHEFDKCVQPLTQRLDRLRSFLQPFSESGKLLHLVTVDGVEQGFACREMAVKRADTDARGVGDSFEAGVRGRRR